MNTDKKDSARIGFVLVWGSLILLLFTCIKCYGMQYGADVKGLSDKNVPSESQIAITANANVETQSNKYPQASDPSTTYVFAENQRIDAISVNGQTYLPISQLIRACDDYNGRMPTISVSEKYDCIIYGERYLPIAAHTAKNDIYISDSDAASLFNAVYDCGILYGMNLPCSNNNYYDAEELVWLSAIINAEARGECFEGMLAVGTVVMNRTESKSYPDTVKDVVFDKRYGIQFSPTEDGSIYLTPSDECMIAAKLCLEGYRTDPDILFFYNPSISDSAYFKEERNFEFRIGNHEFYS